jgi:type III secretion protein HrpB1
MNPFLLRKEFVSGLIDVLNLAIDQMYLDDAEVVLGSLRLLRPKLLQLDMFEGWIAMRRRRWDDAARILSNLNSALPEFETARAFLASCQYSSGDPSWRITATEILENSKNAEALDIVRTLLAPEDEMLPGEDGTSEEGLIFTEPVTAESEVPMHLNYYMRA